MGLVFHEGRFVPEENIQKSTEEARVLRLLRSFLDANEPGLVRILVNTWRSQGKAITYKELREAILDGGISTEYMSDWMQDYSRLVDSHMKPAWESAIEAAVANTQSQYPGWYFDPLTDAMIEWTKNHSAEFVTNVTTAQIEGLRAVVRRAAVLEDMTVDELARAVRPMIGLTKQQTAATFNYYTTLRKNGTSQKRAQDLTARYAARQHRSRGYTVARTELATAYNKGAREGTLQAQAAGLLGETVKVWSTALDERVCRTCGALEGKRAEMDEEFPGISRSWSSHLEPPAHPGCRCAVMYVEVKPPRKNNVPEIIL